jgi:chromosome partitioning protein
MAYLISITNEKGGVAKTTTAISIGAALVESGKRVLLVDLDSQANLTLYLGVDPLKTSQTIVNVLMDNANLNTIIQETGVPGLYLLPANHEMSYIERLLPTRSGYETCLKSSISKKDSKFDFIIFDCPPFLGAVVLNALTASDLLIIPTQPEYFSIYALKNMMGLVRRVRNHTNPALTYRLLITMFDGRNRIHRTMAEQLRSSFQGGVLQTMITVDTKLRESTIAGLPIIYHAPKSRSALQYRELAQEIDGYVKETA